MELSFADRKLGRCAQKSSELARKFGQVRGKKIEQRLNTAASVAAADGLFALPGNWHELTGDRSGQLAAALDGPFRLTFLPTPPVPKLDDGGTDWSAVTAMTVIDVTNYH